jgi:hypothetical protein
MKKILLSIFSIFLFSFYSNAQTVLNEVYVDPGAGNHEYFELFNNRADNLPVNVDCWSIVTYWNDGMNEGWYVLDLPSFVLGPQGFLKVAAAGTFNLQGTPGETADIDWNSMDASGKMSKYQFNGTGYDDISGSIPPNFNDFFVDNPTGGQTDYIIFVFVDGVYRNGLLGGQNVSYISDPIGDLPNLTVPIIGTSCNTDFIIDFSGWKNGGSRVAENVNAAAGTDNGYYRTADGACGTWNKSSSGAQHTPGNTNGNPVGLTGSLTVNEVMACNGGTNPSSSKLTTTVTNSNPDNFPVEVAVFYDNGTTMGALDASDTPVGTQEVASTGGSVEFDNLTPNYATIIVRYRTQFGCTDQLNIKQECNFLPVSLSHFIASRNNDDVDLDWETVSEQNNTGFEVQRRIGNGGFETISFVESKAPDGNSNSRLSYSYTDLNTTDGITQYRLRQVDFDNRSTYSDIRAVRGGSQKAKTIIYPSPSSIGMVNVVFEETEVTRDVSLIDMSGRIVRQWNSIRSNNIQITDLTRGVYSLRIADRDDGTQTIEKFIVR